jgi:hypothetical protein
MYAEDVIWSLFLHFTPLQFLFSWKGGISKKKKNMTFVEYILMYAYIQKILTR